MASKVVKVKRCNVLKMWLRYNINEKPIMLNAYVKFSRDNKFSKRYQMVFLTELQKIMSSLQKIASSF